MRIYHRKIPAAPSLISPSGVIPDTRPPYKWNASDSATVYRIGVYSVGSASYVLLTDVPASTCLADICTFDQAMTLNAGEYRFKVLAKNAYGASPYSEWMKFTVTP